MRRQPRTREGATWIIERTLAALAVFNLDRGGDNFFVTYSSDNDVLTRSTSSSRRGISPAHVERRQRCLYDDMCGGNLPRYLVNGDVPPSSHAMRGSDFLTCTHACEERSPTRVWKQLSRITNWILLDLDGDAGRASLQIRFD